MNFTITKKILKTDKISRDNILPSDVHESNFSQIIRKIIFKQKHFFETNGKTSSYTIKILRELIMEKSIKHINMFSAPNNEKRK